MNKWEIQGFIGQDAKLYETSFKNGKDIILFSIAVNDRKTGNTIWVNTKYFAEKNESDMVVDLKKGTKVTLVGSYAIDANKKGKDGIVRDFPYMLVEQISFQNTQTENKPKVEQTQTYTAPKNYLNDVEDKHQVISQPVNEPVIEDVPWDLDL